MEYKNIVEGIFLERPNRFIAMVDINGIVEKVHVKNTGRCKELLVTNATVYLQESDNPNRKTKFSLICVKKGDMLINMDSQVPNRVVEEAILEGKIEEIGEVDFLKREVTYEKSRFDIYYEKNGVKGFVEVKGVTLEEAGVGMFPDAPTQRGEKHIRELIKAKKEGYEASILFLVQMKGVKVFTPNYKTDMPLAKALEEAEKVGVKILVYDCVVTKNSIVLDEKIILKKIKKI
ncbi:MAG: DNA/RNA nuclease SfsA [Anaerotignaceae bacterium]